MTDNTSTTYERIYQMVRNGYTGDSSIWEQTYQYIFLHPDELFLITSNRRWSIGHQLIYHGNLKLFKRLLLLYSETNPINIYSTTKDTPKPLTILDIAQDRKEYYREQLAYVEHLFAQDKFIRACRTYNWPVIDEMLAKDGTLLNEKPPYCSNYFIHYLVLYDDIRKLDQYNSPDNKLQFDLKNADGKTALDLARDNKNQALIDELQQSSGGHQRESDTSRDVQSASAHGFLPHNTQNTAPALAVSPEIMKNLACPLTKKLFVDPVLASDGKTYERKAIIDWLGDHRYSPLTGESLDDTLTNNNEIKKLIADLRQQKLLP